MQAQCNHRLLSVSHDSKLAIIRIVLIERCTRCSSAVQGSSMLRATHLIRIGVGLVVTERCGCPDKCIRAVSLLRRHAQHRSQLGMPKPAGREMAALS